VSGKVDDVKGTCPNLTFTLANYRVVTDDSTTYTKSSCKDVRNGKKARVKGTVSGGTITASSIEVEK
jgi:hypothetical protein